jgi:hypothetical protein
MATGIIVPGRLVSQPQFVAPIAPELGKYNPTIVVLPAALRNLANNQTVSLANDAVRKNGNFYFPGADGYLDLGSDATIGGSNYSFVVVCKLDSFVNSFPVVFGVKNSINANLMAFYSNNGSYADITIGQNSIGEQFPLTQFGSVTGTWHKLVFTNNAGTTKLFCNGVNVPRTAANALGASTGNSCLGQLNPGNLATDFNGSIAAFALFNGILPDALAQAISANPWRMFQAPSRRIWVAVGGAGPTTYNQSLAGSITATGALSRRTGKALAGSSTATGTLSRQTGKQLSGSSTPSGALAKLTSKAFAGSLTGTGGLVKQTAKSFTGSITGSGALATMILFTASFAGSITPSGALSKMTQKALVGASTVTGAITKLTSKGLSASIIMSGALNKLTTKAFAGSITVTGALFEAYQVVKSLAGSITPTGALAAAYIAFVAGVLKMLSLMGVGQ